MHAYDSSSDGPFTVEGGRHTSTGNEEFDASLRQRNPEWGYRDVEEVRELARSHGLDLVQQVDMPANNFCLVFTRFTRGTEMEKTS